MLSNDNNRLLCTQPETMDTQRRQNSEIYPHIVSTSQIQYRASDTNIMDQHKIVFHSPQSSLSNMSPGSNSKCSPGPNPKSLGNTKSFDSIESRPPTALKDNSFKSYVLNEEHCNIADIPINNTSHNNALYFGFNDLVSPSDAVHKTSDTSISQAPFDEFKDGVSLTSSFSFGKDDSKPPPMTVTSTASCTVSPLEHNTEMNDVKPALYSLSTVNILSLCIPPTDVDTLHENTPSPTFDVLNYMSPPYNTSCFTRSNPNNITPQNNDQNRNDTMTRKPETVGTPSVDEFGYIRISEESLQILSATTSPDLSGHRRRCRGPSPQSSDFQFQFDENSNTVHRPEISSNEESGRLIIFSNDDQSLGQDKMCGSFEEQCLMLSYCLKDDNDSQNKIEKVDNERQNSEHSTNSSSVSVFDLPLPGIDSEHVIRPAAQVSSEQLEDPDKKSIMVVNQIGLRTPVTWYSDQDPNDVKVAILCACDCMMDTGFVLSEVKIQSNRSENLLSLDPVDDFDAGETSIAIDGVTVRVRIGKSYDFEQLHELRNGKTYLLESANERMDLMHIIGDKWRRLRIEIDPRLHEEVKAALRAMTRGTNLLKHTNVCPHLRQFQLTADCRRLVWYSSSRKKNCFVPLSGVVELIIGQKTDKFRHYPMAMLKHLSFSIVFKVQNGISDEVQTLDLTCKDENEFDMWVIGLKGIIYWLKSRAISKMSLMSHSRRFREALETSNPSVNLCKAVTSKTDSLDLCDYIKLPHNTKEATARLLSKLRNRHEILKAKITKSQIEGDAQNSVSEDLQNPILELGEDVSAAASAFSDEFQECDKQTEKNKLMSLVLDVDQMIQKAVQQLDQILTTPSTCSQVTAIGSDGNIAVKNENEILRSLARLVWACEVDIENEEDIFSRLTRTDTDFFKRTIDFLNTSVPDSIQWWSDRISNSLNSLMLNLSETSPEG